ncbi:hypothetical protein M1116_04460 [Patescibacteria group bacterium]|nr:hypothetical protein [Patescibacteria group bacterium]
MSNSIPAQVIKGLGQIGEETGKELLNQTGKIAETIITGKELLGDIKPLSEPELAQKKAEEEKKKQEEMAKLREQMGKGRNVEAEMEALRKEEEKAAKEKEEIALNAEQQRMAADQNQGNLASELVSSNPAKQKKSRGSALMGGKRKKSQPDQQQMSQTSEFKGKID